LTRASLVTADSRVVQVDLLARFEPDGRDPGLPLGWDELDEPAIHAVVLTVLRLQAEAHDASALAERSLLAEPVAHALGLAPVASGFTSRVASVEVGPYEVSSAGDHVFRVVG
jgi:hypothetical protein